MERGLDGVGSTSRNDIVHRLAWGDADRAGSIVERFECVVEAVGDHAAVVGPSGRLTYSELAAAAGGLADIIRSSVGESRDPVALVYDHDLQAIVAILGSLMAGRPYAALDPAVPITRHRQTLESLGPAAFVSGSAHRDLARQLAGPGVGVVIADDAGIDASGVGTLSGEVADPDDVVGVYFTSGTTGGPKGVIRTHRTILHRTRHEEAAFGFGPGDVMSLLYSCSFGTSVNDIFSALLNGATLSIHQVLDTGVGSMGRWIERDGVTALHAPIALMRRFLDTLDPGQRFESLRVVVPSGRMYREDIRRIFRHVGPSTRIVSRYASTESSLACRLVISRDTELPDGPVPVGTPVGDVELSLRDESGGPVERGASGEIFVTSRHLSPGYWRDPVRTAERFTPDPSRPGHATYRSGDHGRLLDDGNLQLAGRRDDMVKIRGYRIELDEVIDAIYAIDGVVDATVDVQDRRGSDQLVGHVVFDGDTVMTVGALRESLSECLPSYMVPAHFFVLDELPLTASGRLDKTSLPRLQGGRPDLAVEYVPPSNDIETALVEIWSEALGVGPVGVHDRFLDLGGDSLTAMRIAGQTLARYRIDLPVRSLLESGTVSAMAAGVERAVSGHTGDADVGIPRRSPTDVVPPTFGQQGLWLAHQLAPTAYTMPKVVELVGPLDGDLLRASIEHVVARHDGLRSNFRLIDGDIVVTGPSDAAPEIEFVDIAGAATSLESHVNAAVAKTRRAPFDLEYDVLFRATVLHTAFGRHAMVVTTHHIAGDRRSTEILLEEIAAGYRALTSDSDPALPPLPIEHADFAVWQRKRIDDVELRRQIDFWVEAHRGATQGLEPLVRSDTPAGGRRGAERCVIDSGFVPGLHVICREQRLTAFVCWLGIAASALARVADRSDLVIGTTVSGRSRVELERMVGYFVNLLPVRLSDGGDRTAGWIRAARGAVADALEHSDVPFDRLVAELNPPRVPGRTPLVDVVFQFSGEPDDSLDFGNVRGIRRRDVRRESSAPLEIKVRSGESSVDCEVTFDDSVVRRQTAVAIARALEHAFVEASTPASWREGATT